MVPYDNMSKERPDPQLLLEKISKETKTRGDLTVFLGAMAGVGKTFTMLKTAKDKISEGKDIVIGWVETHGRSDTEKMADGIPIVSPIEIIYHDRPFAEINLDAILERRPDIVIVDELAHTNIPGSRHRRRYQDVEEILKAGINVYTAVNIQHIESLNDIVAQITGVIVQETVPDSILENAENIQLVDIAPEELQQRLKDGKVYIPSQAQQALKKFFRPGNIGALRELALRFTAQHVDKNMEEYMRLHNISGPWQAAGRVMVGISGSPFSAQLLRAAARLAAGMHSELLAVHVEAPNSKYPLGDKERDCIANNMRIAEDLGAKTFTVVGDSFIDEFLDLAYKQNVTAIVVGKSKHHRFTDFWHGSIVDNIIKKSGDINVYVVQGNAEKSKESKGKKISLKKLSQPSNLKEYVLSLLMVAVIDGISVLMHDYFEPVDAALLYLIPVLFSAVWWGRWPSYLAGVVGVFSFDFLFVHPLETFTIGDWRYLVSFVIFLLVAFLIGGRTEKLRVETKQARQQEKSTRAVYEFSKDIVAINEVKTIAESLAKHAGETIERRVIVFLPKEKDELEIMGIYDPKDSIIKNDNGSIPASEQAIAAWVYKNKQSAGRTTETLPGGKYLYLPLCSQHSILGVCGIDMAEKRLTPSETRMVNAWVWLAAATIEKIKLAEQAKQAELLIEADRLRGALFNSISHELKTPLAAILGSVSTLIEDDALYSKLDRIVLLENVKESSLRMERLIINLLDTARLESGMMQLKRDWCDIEDIIGIALQRMHGLVEPERIEVDIQADLPLFLADCVLVEQVLMNLIDNAAKYSPSNEKILIKAEVAKSELKVSVLDRGVGVPTEDLNKIFDKFYRVKQPKKVSGTGLGLSICRGIIEAHKGRIYAENRIDGRGTEMIFILPVESYDKIINRGE